MTAAKHRPARSRGRILAWHRRIGLFASVVIGLVVLTGLPLNHVERLGLDKRLVSNPAVLAGYGMERRRAATSFRLGKDWLSAIGGAVYLNARPLGQTVDAIRGAVAVDESIVVAAPDAILIFGKDGALVERITAASLPGSIEAIGLTRDRRVALRGPGGQFAAGSDLIDWRPSAETVAWAQPGDPPAPLRAAIEEAHRGRGIPWSRLLLDIHTGRILGSWGPYLIDAAGLALLVLVGTGLHNWLARER